MVRIFATLLLFAATLQSVYSQERGVEITFEAAAQMALSKNGVISISEHSREAKVYYKKSMASLRAPSFSINAAYSYLAEPIGVDLNGLKTPIGGLVAELGLPVTPTMGALLGKDWSATLQEQQFAVVAATASMPIFTGFKINAANNAAKLQIDEEDLNRSKKINGLYTELVERYFGLVLALEAQSLRAEVLKGMQHHLEDAILLEKNGMIAKVDRLYAQVKVSEAKAELKKAQAEVATIRSGLKATLNSDQSYSPISSLFILSEIESLEGYKAKMLAQNLTLKEIDLKEKLAKEALRAERADYYPHIAAMAGANLYDYQLTPIIPKWAVGVGLKFNIFNGLKREFKVKESKSKIEMVKSIRDKAKTDLLSLIEKQYNDLVAAKENIEAQNVVVEFATEYLRVKELAFKSGVATSSDVSDAILNLSKAKTERIKYSYQFDVALSKLLESCGESEKFLALMTSPSYRQITVNGVIE